jgi:hypothetical protein
VTLAEVQAFTVPSEVVDKTEASLRRAGRDGFEMFVLWSGVIAGDRFLVRTAHVPRQDSYRLETGLVVRVDGEALHRLNAWLFEHDEILAVQVHAHPTDAFHSDTDEAYPIVTARGGLSIVAADFCNDGVFSATSAFYRLGDLGWDEVTRPDELIQVA